MNENAAPILDCEPEPQSVSQGLGTILSDMLDVEGRFASTLNALPDAHRESARNLLHYLALRRRDLRGLQTHLAERGLSSLGRAEAHVWATVEAARHAFERLVEAAGPASSDHLAAHFARGRDALEANTCALLGPTPVGRDVRIMVTLPGEAADDPAIVRGLVESGMDCLRINAAHDDADVWDRMLRHLAQAERETGRSCRILMDMAGPKLRTGLIEPGPAVIKWRPVRDIYGRVTKPARLWLTRRDRPCRAPESAEATLPVDGEWLARLRIGDTIELVDARFSSSRPIRRLPCTRSR